MFVVAFIIKTLAYTLGLGLLMQHAFLLEASLPEATSKRNLIKVCPNTLAELSRDITENVRLDDPFSQFPVTHVIPPEQVEMVSILADSNGESAKARLIQFGPSTAQETNELLPVQNMALESGEIPRDINGRPFTDEMTQTIQRYLGTDWKQYLEPREIAKPGRVINTKKSQIELSSTGINRYFLFRSTESRESFPARVLDIHRLSSSAVIILFEWMTEYTENTDRIRYISTLSSQELSNIPIPSEEQRRVIESLFEDTLSPNEIEARRLAQRLGLKTYGYTNMHSVLEGNSSFAFDPLRSMSNISHSAMRHEIEAKFGKEKINALLADEEKAAPLANIIDVFARLNAKRVLREFDVREKDFQYIFVVTEDGRLKISPCGKLLNLKPQILRLAHGRRIFAGGIFTIESDGQIRLILEPHDYESFDSNPNLERFLAAIFMQQGERTVNQRQEFRSIGNDIFDDFFSATSTPSKTLDWDDEKGPLGLELWAFKVGITQKKEGTASTIREENKKQWAHYVLKTNRDMSKDAIKKAFRLLSIRFHPDKNKNREDAKAAFQNINNASEILITGKNQRN